MSEPMSSVEIEDVLSSIRRLVSEDLRPAARAATAAPPRPAAVPDGEKLILTPALRVVPGVEDTAPEDPQDDKTGRAVDANPQPDPADDWSAPPEFQSVRHESGAESDLQTLDSVAPDAFNSSAAESVSAFGAAMDDGGQANTPDWDIEEAGFVEVEDLPQGDVVGMGRFALDPAPTLSADVADAMGATVDAVPPAYATGQPDADWLPEDLSEWDHVEGPKAADPPTQSADIGAEANRAWADAAEAEVLRRLSEDGEQTVMDADDDRSDVIYDEDVLRELVRDIIREELQGALGERITRNVRKLVRAEISRALAVRDFE